LAGELRVSLRKVITGKEFAEAGGENNKKMAHLMPFEKSNKFLRKLGPL
jgi:hypothetical protein